MKTLFWLRAGLEAVVWYVFIYYLLYVLKNPFVDIAQAALNLLALAYVGFFVCPLLKIPSFLKGDK